MPSRFISEGAKDNSSFGLAKVHRLWFQTAPSWKFCCTTVMWLLPVAQAALQKLSYFAMSSCERRRVPSLQSVDVQSIRLVPPMIRYTAAPLHARPPQILLCTDSLRRDPSLKSTSLSEYYSILDSSSVIEYSFAPSIMCLFE
jgi:hypothetical protein